jgi:hypothetical protein
MGFIQSACTFPQKICKLYLKTILIFCDPEHLILNRLKIIFLPLPKGE